MKIRVLECSTTGVDGVIGNEKKLHGRLRQVQEITALDGTPELTGFEVKPTLDNMGT